MDIVSLFDYRISSRGCVGDVKKGLELCKAGNGPSYMACANPHSLVTAASDKIFKKALNEADILLPDGSGIILAAKILNLPLNEKVAGSDFFRETSIQANAIGNMRYFFLGSSQKVLDKIIQKMKIDYPSIEVCGTYSPPFKTAFSKEENEQMISAVNAAKPDYLWVGMTAPKQEKWIYQNKEFLNVDFIGAIGAVFDFYAGTKKRSSDIWIKLGMEWLPRFLNEPKRLWERNMKSTPVFLCWVLKEKFRILGKDQK